MEGIPSRWKCWISWKISWRGMEELDKSIV